ncbi:MAG TPA: DUF4279 domain-containing protein [Verrucomicrobiae bacterium]|nr:DUF4279 domain-containing protein [Verrucomicrobiae bacterium]
MDLDTRFAYFYFDGSLDPIEITRRTGLSPAAIIKQSESSLPATKTQRNLWKLRSRLDLEAPLESHVKDILDQLDANKNEFVELSRELGGTMQLVSYSRENEPGLYFDQRTMSRIAEYSLRVNCNFYNFR